MYSVEVTRTNLELNDALVHKAMQRYGLSSKRAAVDLALQRLVGGELERDDALSLEGSGWEGDLDALRQTRFPPSAP